MNRILPGYYLQSLSGQQLPEFSCDREKQSSEKYVLVDHRDPERHWSTTQHQSPARAPGPLLVYLDSAWSTSCNHSPEIADQGG